MIFYGKVLNIGAGSANQIFSGTLSVTLVNVRDPQQLLNLETTLRPVGEDGEYSYRMELDQHTNLSEESRNQTLVVGADPIPYAVLTMSVNGFPASLLDPGQDGGLTAGFNSRGEEQRFDIKTEVPTVDTDKDGLPDWWEVLYGLDPADAADASADPDGDGLSNLREFGQSTDPGFRNTVPVVQDARLVVTAGGEAGVYLPVIDADTLPANLRFTLTGAGEDLSWRLGGTSITDGDSFTYADMLDGDVSVRVPVSFANSSAVFLLDDLSSPDVPAQTLTVAVEAFSPMLRWPRKPSVWLDAEQLELSAAVAEWPDQTGTGRDAYQADTAMQPSSDGEGAVNFADGQFLYLDDRQLKLGNGYTVFAVFAPDSAAQDEQALLSASDFNIGLDPGDDAVQLNVLENGRAISGPRGMALSGGRTAALTLLSAAGGSLLDYRLGAGSARFPAKPSARSLVSSFYTIGASRALSASLAEDFFHGRVHEILIYETPLNAQARRLIQDYQATRWQGVRLWNYNLAIVPLTIHGADAVPNSIHGGEGNDKLTGGHYGDTLCGGPGSNILTGGRGGDRFSFIAGATADTVTDFSGWQRDATEVGEIDVIDLAEVLAGKSGPLANYLSISSVVTRDENDQPRVDSILQLNHAGLGTASAVDQTVTLENVSIGESDLPRLIARGSIVTGRAEESAVSVDPLVVDSDGDGVLDAEDALPYDATETVDTDGDRIGNNADPDDDNDGFMDGVDRFPLDPSEWFDTDNDGIGNNADLDDDNDGWSDTREIAAGTNPLDPNSYPVLPERRGLPAGVLELLLGE